MAIINIGWSPTFFWDGRAVTLEEQILEPVSHPDEMALPWSEAVERLQNSEDYTARFAVAFGDDVITPERTTQAIAQFLRTMVSANSKFDQWRRGETFLTDAEFPWVRDLPPRGRRPGNHTWRRVWGALFPLPRGGRPAIQRLPVPQQRVGQHVRSRPRTRRSHRQSTRFGQIQNTHASQHCAHRSLYARRPFPNAGGGQRPLQLGRSPLDHR